MRYILCVLSIVILISSCSRNSDDIPGPPAVPLLKRTVQTNSSGVVTRVMHYNEMELVAFDTAYANVSQAPGIINVYTYNAKGKRTRLDNSMPVLQPGPYWAWEYFFQDDTIPTITHRYLKGNRVARITHIYNASKQLIMDSTYHTPNFGTFTYLAKYTYDASGRLSSLTDLNDTRDTTRYTTYQYVSNSVETWVKSFGYNPTWVSYSLTVTDYTASGKISSEKKYTGQVPQLVSQTDYTYDGMGHLLNKLTVFTNGSPSQEERYGNDSMTGKPQKMEYYVGGQLGSITTYYYE